MVQIKVMSVSWIDQKGLPPIDLGFLTAAAVSWPRRVVLGLAGTANAPPAKTIIDVSHFRQGREYRALMGCTVDDKLGVVESSKVLDPGYTPPFDKSKWGWLVKQGLDLKIPDDPSYYAGESSGLSGIASTRHPASAISIPPGGKVLADGLIKFRAGGHTDKMGIDGAGSPNHVPWVWCEFAVVRTGAATMLLGRGSSFPSHAWYVNGKQVGVAMQQPVAANAMDKAISTGQPSGQTQEAAATDRSEGSVNGSLFTITGGSSIAVDISHLFK